MKQLQRLHKTDHHLLQKEFAKNHVLINLTVFSCINMSEFMKSVVLCSGVFATYYACQSCWYTFLFHTIQRLALLVWTKRQVPLLQHTALWGGRGEGSLTADQGKPQVFYFEITLLTNASVAFVVLVIPNWARTSTRLEINSLVVMKIGIFTFGTVGSLATSWNF